MYALNEAAQNAAIAAMPSTTGRWRSAASLTLRAGPVSAPRRGTAVRIMNAAISASAPIAANGARHRTPCPSKVPSRTPRAVAALTPATTVAIARPRSPSGARCAAVTPHSVQRHS